MTKLYAYVDETGDLGADLSKSGTTSYFGMAGILMSEKGADDACNLIVDLKEEFKIPHEKIFPGKSIQGIMIVENIYHRSLHSLKNYKLSMYS